VYHLLTSPSVIRAILSHFFNQDIDIH
jgi:hypothetical protein